MSTIHEEAQVVSASGGGVHIGGDSASTIIGLVVLVIIVGVVLWKTLL
jgi:hypothetical protein